MYDDDSADIDEPDYEREFEQCYTRFVRMSSNIKWKVVVSLVSVRR